MFLALTDSGGFVPGFHRLWWKDSRNQVFQGRDQEPIMDVTVCVLLCLQTQTQFNDRNIEHKDNIDVQIKS